MGDGDDDAGDRRGSGRVDVTWSVDCETEDTFLYAAITNISVMGIFVQTTDPLPIGTELTLRFAPSNGGREGVARTSPQRDLVLRGRVQWLNLPLPGSPNPGMGIRFSELSGDDRERIVDTVRTIAYLREEPPDPFRGDPGALEAARRASN